MSLLETIGWRETRRSRRGLRRSRRLASGTYRVCFADYGNTYVGECWNDKATVEQASTSRWPKAPRWPAWMQCLGKEARIAGQPDRRSPVLDVANHSVSIRQKVVGLDACGTGSKSGQTDSSGNYEIGGLRAGTYRVCFDGYNTDFLSECWNDKATVELADGHRRGDRGARVTGKDAVLARAGRISGTVTNSAGDGIPNLYVNVQQKPVGASSWQAITSAPTNGQGIVRVRWLSVAGTYRVCFQTYMDAVPQRVLERRGHRRVGPGHHRRRG